MLYRQTRLSFLSSLVTALHRDEASREENGWRGGGGLKSSLPRSTRVGILGEKISEVSNSRTTLKPTVTRITDFIGQIGPTSPGEIKSIVSSFAMS